MLVSKAQALAHRMKKKKPDNLKTHMSTPETVLIPPVPQAPHAGRSHQEAASRAREAREAALLVGPPEVRALPGRTELLRSAERLALGLDCDEVLPGIIISNGRTVRATAYMRELGVTHIINTASRDVWLPMEKLSNMAIKLFEFHVDDVTTANISLYFKSAADMMEEAEAVGGLVVINCVAGLSRSATLLAATLIMTRRWSLARSLATIRQARQVRPNLGFIIQLLELEEQLKAQGAVLS